jgi:hypothetical protein
MHSILRYNIKTKTIDKIIYANGYLNFQPDIIISSINIVGDLLYFTDGYFSKFTHTPPLEIPDSGFNPPRKINMVKAYNYTNNIAVNPLYKYSTISEETLDRIKYPPINKPDVNYNTDESRISNLLIGNLYQFCYRYVYDDGEKSVLSPYSVPQTPIGNESVDQYIYPYNTNNVLEININTGSEIVCKIELFVKLNSLDWYGFYTLEKFDNSDEQIQSYINDIINSMSK